MLPSYCEEKEMNEISEQHSQTYQWVDAHASTFYKKWDDNMRVTLHFKD